MSTSEKEATMIYIKIDNDLFYDDAVVLVRSFYPRTEVTALKADSKPEDDDEIITIEVPDCNFKFFQEPASTFFAI